MLQFFKFFNAVFEPRKPQSTCSSEISKKKIPNVAYSENKTAKFFPTTFLSKMKYFWQMKFTILLLAIRISREEPRIVGGHETTIRKFPFVINICRYYGKLCKHVCAGSLVNPLWILSAAHCIYDNSKMKKIAHKNFLLISGSTTLSLKYEKPQIRTISRSEVLNYNYQERRGEILVLSNDIALIQANRAFALNNRTQLVRLVSLTFMHNKNPWEFFKEVKCIFVGWGRTFQSGSSSEILRVAYLTIMDKEDCRRWKYTFLNVDTTGICTYDETYSPCNGDSGGPLVCNGYQVGICSTATMECKAGRQPGTWTRVDAFYDWIEETISEPINRNSSRQPFIQITGPSSSIFLIVFIHFYQ